MFQLHFFVLSRGTVSKSELPKFLKVGSCHGTRIKGKEFGHAQCILLCSLPLYETGYWARWTYGSDLVNGSSYRL